MAFREYIDYFDTVKITKHHTTDIFVFIRFLELRIDDFLVIYFVPHSKNIQLTSRIIVGIFRRFHDMRNLRMKFDEKNQRFALPLILLSSIWIRYTIANCELQSLKEFSLLRKVSIMIIDFLSVLDGLRPSNWHTNAFGYANIGLLLLFLLIVIT